MASAKLTNQDLTKAANTVRILAADTVEKANSGHPGMPMGMAEMAVTLFLKHLRFNPADPRWINRDRFVLSNGHGCALLYSMLHLCGYDVSMDDLKSFRQWESKTPGHPEFGFASGIEATTGPLGQGISNAIGMAIGQRLLAARYNTETFKPVDHKIFVFAGDGCLMEGVSSEASSIAGHLGLSNLIVFYDDNHISIAGNTELAFTEDARARYKAYGWRVLSIDGHDFDQIDKAVRTALREQDKPVLIAARTTIGKGSPHKANTAEVHGAPLGKEELELTKKGLDWPLEPSFLVPEEVREMFQARVKKLQREYRRWQKDFAAWQQAEPEKACQLQGQIDRKIPDDIRQRLLAAVPPSGKPAATRKLSESVLQAASAAVPALIGGSADLEPSTLTLIKGSSDVEKNAFSGKNLRFGVREHAMGAIMNGLSYYGCFIPYGSTFLTFADYMRPTIRLAALSKIQSLFIFTHDSVFLGEDGPTHQPVEHLNALRIIPAVYVFRPADGMETAVCYEVALKRHNGPSVIALTRQNVDPIERRPDFDAGEIAKGGYVVYESGEGAPDVVFVATGSELPLAIASAKQLSGIKTRVVSMPCFELFQAQDEDYRRRVLPKNARKVTIEAGTTFGWRELVEGGPDNTLRIGIDHFGMSAPYKVIAERLGFTPASVVQRVKQQFSI